MNIFNVLSMGKSRLHETSMSAMLAYLIDPSQDHGLGKKFLHGFLELSNNNGLYSKYIEETGFKFQIDLEVPYYHNNKRNDIDIQIKIFDKSYKELHRILIENKIKSGASDSSQLQRYYDAAENDKDEDKLGSEAILSVIFLTPKQNSKGLKDEFDNLQMKEKNNKVWIYWSSDNAEDKTIVRLIQDILTSEHQAYISPINEYMRHTLKAFAYFANKTINTKGGKNRTGEDIGDVLRKEIFEINDKQYTIVLRNSGQIQLLNDEGEKISAKPILVEFLKLRDQPVNPSKENTRQIGKRVLEIISHG